MKKTVGEKLKQAEELIHAGQSKLAQNELMNLRFSEASRKDCLKGATLLRRTGAYEAALKVLYPFVRSKNPNILPEAKEIAIYAGLLNSIGGSEEAIRLISSSKANEQETSAQLTLAFAYFSQWNYEAALPILENYLLRVDPSSYEHAIGQVNYVASLVATEKFEEAIELLVRLKDYFDKHKMKILLGNCNEILGQVFFKLKQFEKALPCLEQANDLLGGKEPDTLFVKKWRLFIALTQNPADLSILHEIEDLRRTARSMVLWETPRDIDLNVALITQDSNLLSHVFYGSPFAGYRQKIQMKQKCLISPLYTRNLGEHGPGQTFDVEDLARQADLRHGSLERRLLTILLQDFYRPHRGANIFNQVYVGENFDPEHSQNKVKLLVSRLRKRLEPIGLGVTNVLGKSYRLSGNDNIKLVYHFNELRDKGVSKDLRLLKVHRAFPENWFTTQNLSVELGVSSRTASRWLNEWVESKQVIQQGSRKAARYRLPKVS